MSIVEIHTAALDRFAKDVFFLEVFLPIACARDPETTRALLRGPLNELIRDELA